MPYVQPICPNGNIKWVQFRSKVEFTKIKIKKHIRFSKTPTLELDEGNESTFAKFEYERSSLKTEPVFEKTNMISSELLNIIVVGSCDRAKFYWVCAKSWDVYTNPKKSYTYTLFKSLLHICSPFMWLFEYFSCIFLRDFFLKLSCDRAKKSTFRMSASSALTKT